ncbi:transglutaminase domain-containing protein [Terriglobus saanensis SP1PR4]|uniref:Transglutaminase domain-containing protein n=2 Tax=Terriglobus saanensis TaxID=870903 RepID=E8V0T0_TERSS|nr:transglutaminase domain-containing protein [Terriglobus saanensis SP1PR4]
MFPKWYFRPQSHRSASAFCDGLGKVLFCLTLCTGFFESQAFAKDKMVAPDWVKQASAQPMRAFPPKTDAVVLLHEVNVSVNAQGREVTHEREVIRILRAQGRRGYGSPAVYYNDTVSKVTSMKVWSIGADGHEYAVKDNEMIDRSSGEGFEVYTDSRMRYASPPSVDVGSVVAIESEIETRPYVTEILFPVQREIPVRRERLTITMPPGFIYKAVWKGPDRTKSVDMEHGTTLWEMEDEPGIDLEDVPLSGSAWALVSRLSVHYTGPGMPTPTLGEWNGIGAWYAELAAGRNLPNDAITKQAQSLVQGKTDFAERAQAIGEYVQQRIRYVAVEIGVGGQQPHAAGDTFSHQYGDCKDKATLVSAMMNAVGMRATWLMVDSRRGVIAPEAPSIAANHMIVAIDIPKGYESPLFQSTVTLKNGKRYLIFDPTSEKTPFGQLESGLQGSYGLLMEGKESEAILLPVLKPGANQVNRKASFTLSSDGDLKGHVSEERSGDIAGYRRHIYSEWNSNQQSQFLHGMLARDFTSFEVAEVKVSNVEDLQKTLSICYGLEATHFARVTGPLLMVRPRVLFTDGMRVDRKARFSPIDLNETRRVHDEYDIALPSGYAVEEMPEPVKLDLGFAKYESSSSVKDGKLHYSRTYEVREVTLPAERYDEVRKLAGVIEADEQSNAILKRIP